MTKLRDDISKKFAILRGKESEELNSMAGGGNVKETVMSIPFLWTCTINMIADVERKFTSDGNKKKNKNGTGATRSPMDMVHLL